MKAPTKKIYSLASAIVLVALALLLSIGALLPTFRVNMATTPVTDIFSKSSLTSSLVCDGADVGVGAALALVANYKQVILVNKVSFAEFELHTLENEIKALYEELAKSQSEESTNTLTSQINEKTDEYRQKTEALLQYKENIPAGDLAKLSELLRDESFVNGLFMEISLMSVLIEAIEDGAGDNYLYDTNYFDIVIFFVGIAALAGLILSTAVFALVCVLAFFKAALRLAGSIKNVDQTLLKELFARSATGMVLLPLTFFMLAKVFFGSTLEMGAGLVLALVAVTLLSLLHTANRIVLAKRRDSKAVVKTVITLVGVLLSLALLTAVADLNLVEGYRNSNEANARAAYDAKYETALAQELEKITDPNNHDQVNHAKAAAEAAAKTYVTEKLVSGAAPLLVTACLMALLSCVTVGAMLERLAGKESKDGGEDLSPQNGVCLLLSAVLLVGSLFTATLGVTTVEARNKAYLDENGGVEILFNAHEQEGTDEKLALEAVTELHAEILRQIESKVAALGSASGSARTQVEQELDALGRTAHLCEQTENALSVNHKGLIVKGAVFSLLLILLEILLWLAPALTDKYLPDRLKKLLEGNGEEADESAPANEPSPDAEPTAE